MQNLFTNDRHWAASLITITSLLTAAPAISRAGTVFYTSIDLFHAAAPGLPVETFASANLFGQPEAVQSSPLDSATNRGAFTAGSILPGLTISNLVPVTLPYYGLIVYDVGPGGGSKSVGDNYFGDSVVLTFAPAVTAVGASVFANTSPGMSLGGDFTESIFNGTTLLGSRDFSAAAGEFAFIGVTSTIPITRVQLLYTTTDATTFVSDIAFGPVQAELPTSTPEPPTFAVAGMALILLGAGWRACHQARLKEAGPKIL